ncbi:hypothetical protein [Metabacillus bambusae]|uniref:Uncharacterized protein n=1 Tax=Metabacillus bambusae TaxID=2795218 RepID=A0ABS3NA32_9BACI|nr:hypothetical protein [Metabacillus bambusae]MBO1515000.1 hypothetical protein [Metabacillus bambusae]
MKKQLFGKVVKLGMVLSIAATVTLSGFGGVASAEEQQSNTPSPIPNIQESVEQYVDTTKSFSAKEEKELTKIAKSNLNELEMIKKGDLDTNNPVIKALNDGTTFVQFLIKDSSKLEDISGVSFVIDENNSVASVNEIYVKLLDEESAELRLFTNGEEVISEILEKPDVMPQWSWSVLNNCLASQGISWTVIAVVGVVCGGICLVTAGAGCVWCIMVEASATGSVAAMCVKKAAEA